MFWTLWNVDAAKPAHPTHLDWRAANALGDVLEATLGVRITLRRA